MNFATLFPPKKTEFYLESLKNNDLESYYMVQAVIQGVLEEYGGTGGFQQKAEGLINNGIISPIVVKHDSGEAIVFFKIWSFYDNEYKIPSELSYDEMDLFSGIVDYYLSCN